jgi:NitT/TauT family transport system permease protein
MQRIYTHYSHRSHHKHPVSLGERVGLWLLLPVVIIVVAAILVGTHTDIGTESISFSMLLYALAASLGRLVLAYIAALVIGIALALFVVSSPARERILIPIYDVLESVPVLVFFPVIIIVFINYGWFNAAAIFIIFLNMLWNIVFSVIGGIKLIPADVTAVPRVFGLRGATRFFKITLPALVPSLITGSLLAWAEGWNMLIVAEVLHTYVPAGSQVSDLFGIGSVLVNASAYGQHALFVWSIITIVVAIMLLNIFVWQKLLRMAERFKFD